MTLQFLCLVWLGGQLVDMEVDTGSAVRLVYCRVLQKAKTDFKLGMVTEPAVSANGRPLDIQGKCVLEIFLGGVLVAEDITQDCLR